MAPRERDGESRPEGERPPNWRVGRHGGSPEDSPDDFDERNPDEQSEASDDAWRATDEGAEASPDDFDEEPAGTGAGSTDAGSRERGSQQQAKPRELHTELQQRLGEDYEVIFEAEGFQVRRAPDRAFIAEYDPDHHVVSTGAHVLFHDRTGESRDKLIAEGRKRIDARVNEWKSFGFEPVEEGHLVGVPQMNSDLFKDEVPRYIQPMQKSVDSIDEVVEAVEWVRKHRKF